MKTVMYHSAEEMNDALLNMFQNTIMSALRKRHYVNVGIATGRTYSSFIHLLNQSAGIPYDKVNLFMIDEYAGVDPYDMNSCAIDLIREMKCLGAFRNFFTFTKYNFQRQIEEYNAMLEKHPFDLLLLGIGENGHYGFCQRTGEKELATYKIVDFSEDERQQQVELGWFSDIAEVPLKGITITEYGVWKSQMVILAAYYEQKKKIIEKIEQKRVDSHMAIYPLLSKQESILIYG